MIGRSNSHPFLDTNCEPDNAITCFLCGKIIENLKLVVLVFFATTIVNDFQLASLQVKLDCSWG